MLPHIKNSKVGMNNFDPVFSCLFEGFFDLPAVVKEVYGSEDIALLKEQILSIGGLGTLDKGPEASVKQKFMGVDRTFLSPKLDDTTHQLSIKLNLNLRNTTDNFVWKIFKTWQDLGYNKETGETSLKKDYIADNFRIIQYNAAGDIYRDVVYHNVMLDGSIEGMDELNYETTEAVQIDIKLKSDWADDKYI